jgi:hypothetical protein
MRRIVECAQFEMKWEKPSVFKACYELRLGDMVIAELSFRSMWGSLVRAESGDGCWSFKRVGFFKPRITVRLWDSEQDIALFYPNTWSAGGTLVLPDGRNYKVSTNFWHSKVEFSNEVEGTLIRYSVGGFFRHSALVEVAPAALRLTELPWMVILGWYLIILMHQDSSAAHTAAVPVG